jgi:hypothetical protein
MKAVVGENVDEASTNGRFVFDDEDARLGRHGRKGLGV